MKFFKGSHNQVVTLQVCLGIYTFILLYWAYQISPMNDYYLYFRHWDLVLSGGDPWMKMPAANAYGPIYNLFAWLYSIDHQLPKLVFLTAWLSMIFYSLVIFLNNKKVKLKVKFLYSIFWLFNPFFILSTVFYGLNDGFVASLVFLSLILLLRFKKRLLALVIMTFGVLTKLYPIFLFPFFSTNKNQILKNFFVVVFLLTLVYLITFFIWGDSFLNAFGKANGRDPTLFSIMRFVTGNYFPFDAVGQVILALSNVFILVSIGFLFRLYKTRRLAQHTALLAGFTVLLLFYKAGQQQFYLTYFSVFSVWVLIEFQRTRVNFKAFYSVLFLGAWFALMAGIVYPLTNGMNGNYEWLREVIGLPTFLLLSFILYNLIKYDNFSCDNTLK